MNLFSKPLNSGMSKTCMAFTRPVRAESFSVRDKRPPLLVLCFMNTAAKHVESHTFALSRVIIITATIFEHNAEPDVFR